ncbi:iron uptake system protein EfeO [Corynebacterium suicordis]|uniref:EfeM/EfeO family lipoprotein n=1 Tax=Corynebacterium suicordis DSM 45110 TaxID=1121369 RepID=A0ABR9ZIR7_9CORY|nr:iron uptake system protein EfeO [Corynebacterium suicordis]MBF4553336.1 EfeM/EfeO family lipoprotein [Corynebacterium suicordis DSM 45110]MDR6277691.1 iron uptake system component EfeO [Corynebacterium suicordis]
MSKKLTATKLLAPALAASLLLAGCADKAEEGAAAIDVKADDTTCELGSTETSTGSTTFNVTNSGTKINEFYVMTSGGRILGEVENIGPGASRTLIVEFQEAGDYTTLCKPGMVGEGISGTLKVTGDDVNSAEGDAALTESVDNYTSYVRSQTKNLQDVTENFTAAIQAGDVEKAKELFPQVRTPYERIEPVAESFPDDLDPRIDLREADLAEGDKWTGFHRIEKDLWVEGKITDETKQMADQLSKDIQELIDGVNADDFKLTPVQIASGAQGLLDEIATSKITGEEDIFSHTDLYDFQANLEGSKAAIASLEKPMEERKPGMLKEINSRFDAVQSELNKHREGEGFVSYDKVSESDRKALSTALDHLTEEVSMVQAVISE